MRVRRILIIGTALAAIGFLGGMIQDVKTGFDKGDQTAQVVLVGFDCAF
jgi:hypothetical protein